MELKEIKELAARLCAKPYDAQCLSEAIRHLIRNVDHELYCPEESHDDPFGKYDGASLAALLNAVPSLIADVDKYRKALEQVVGLYKSSQLRCEDFSPGMFRIAEEALK